MFVLATTDVAGGSIVHSRTRSPSSLGICDLTRSHAAVHVPAAICKQLGRERRARTVRRRWLSSAAAVVQRRNSQMAFHALSPRGAAMLVQRDYGPTLSSASANPTASVAHAGHLVRYLSDYAALVRTPSGKLKAERSTVPLRITQRGGPKQPVSLTLRQAGAAYLAANPLQGVVISRWLSGGVEIGGEGLRITMQGADAAGTPRAATSIFFANVGPDEDATAAPTIDGAELASILRSRLSPQEISYRLSLPRGATLRPAGGGAAITGSGRTLARIPAPTARDAQGTAVPVSMRVAGDELVLSVLHRSRDLAYPLLVDPEVVITNKENEAKWQRERGEGGCGIAGMVAKPGSIEQPLSGFPGPCHGRDAEGIPLGENRCKNFGPKDCVRCVGQEGEGCIKRSDGSSVWESEPLLPTSGRTILSAEFDNVSLGAGGSAFSGEQPPADGHWFLSTSCTWPPGAGKSGEFSYPEAEVPPTTVAISQECYGPERAVSLGLNLEYRGPQLSYENSELGEQSLGASISAQAILVGETFASEPGAETYGLQNEGEPSRSFCAFAGDVDCASGNQVVTQNDFEIEGRGPGLSLTRTYNSHLAEEETKPGPFGYGWSSSYIAHLDVGAGLAVVHQENGSTVAFVEEANGTYVPSSPLIQAKLQREGSNWTYTLPDQEKLLFNGEGRLVSQSDRNGNKVTLAYKEVCEEEEHGLPGIGVRPPSARPLASPSESCPHLPEWRRLSIEDEAGRMVAFTYNSKGLVEKATDPMGHVVKYGYENGYLTSVTEPGESAPTWKLAYNSARELTSETDALGHTSSTEYESGRVISQTDPMGHKRSWHYSESGAETTITEPNGSLTVVKLNTSGLPTSITRASGTPIASTTSYEYDEHDNLAALIDPNGHKTTYAYDAEGNRTTETDALDHKTEWTYDAAHDVMSETAPNGEKKTITRDGHGNATEVSRPAPGGQPQATTYSYDSKGDVETMTDPLGRTSRYEYDNYGDRSAEIDPEGDKRTFAYNGDSQEISATTAIGNVEGVNPADFTTTIERDAGGHPVLVSEPPAGEAGYSMRQEFRPTIFERPSGIAVGPNGDIWVAETGMSRIDKFSKSGEYLGGFGSTKEDPFEDESCSWQMCMPIAVAVDPEGHVWVVEWQEQRVREFTEEGTPLRTIGGAIGNGHGEFEFPWGIAIDKEGHVFVSDAGNGRIEEFSKEGAYMAQLGSPGEGEGQFEWPEALAVDPTGNLWVADADNHRVQECEPQTDECHARFGTQGSGPGQFEDMSGLAVLPNGNVLVGDSNGNYSRVELFSEREEYLGQFGSRGYGFDHIRWPSGVAVDSEGNALVVDQGSPRVQRWTLAATTRNVYGSGERLESVTDPNGNTTRYAYDADGEPTTVTEPDGSTQQTEYDAEGQTAAQIDPNGHKTTYVRNALEEPTEVIDPLGRKTARSYDKAGNLEAETNAESQTTRYSYDADNRRTKVSYSDGKTPSVEYEYNEDGDRTKMIDGSGTTTSSYDQLDRPTEVKDGHGDAVRYEYDLADEPTRITYPNGKSVERSYNHTGRLSAVKDWLGNTTSFSYDQDSELTQVAYPEATGGEHDSYSYNAAGEVQGIEMAKGKSELASLSYRHDSDGQVTASTTYRLPGEGTVQYSYDTRSRLTGAGATDYGYDPAGNPVKIGSATNAFNEADELTAGAGTSYAYDARGERTKATPTTGPATTYAYDQAGNLTSISRPAEGQVPKIADSYVYNGDGLRASQTISGTSDYLTWDAAEGLPLLLSDGVRSFVYGPGGEPIEQIASDGAEEEVLYLHHDQQGSTRMLTNQEGGVEATFSYDAYGNLTGSTGTATTPLGYDGQYTDRETGLIYLRARTYDPVTAQFLSGDPEVATTREPYGYAADNPVSSSDPGGLYISGCYKPSAPCGIQEAREERRRHAAKQEQIRAEINAVLTRALEFFNAPAPREGVKYDVENINNGYIVRQPGSTGDANTVRVMGKSRANPDGSLVYYDEHGHPVDYKTGGVPKTRADYHVPYGNKLPLKNYPKWLSGG